MSNSFGFELTLDCYECNSESMDNISTGYEFLDRATSILKVHKMTAPYVFRAPDGYTNSGGTSGWVGIIESGIGYHAMSKRNFVAINYFTCATIDSEMEKALIRLATEVFSPKKIDSKLIERGVHYND